MNNDEIYNLLNLILLEETSNVSIQQQNIHILNMFKTINEDNLKLYLKILDTVADENKTSLNEIEEIPKTPAQEIPEQISSPQNENICDEMTNGFEDKDDDIIDSRINMSGYVFEKLQKLLEERGTFNQIDEHSLLSASEALILTIMFLEKGDTFEHISKSYLDGNASGWDRYCIISYTINYIISEIIEHMSTFIAWPQEEEIHKITQEFTENECKSDTIGVLGSYSVPYQNQINAKKYFELINLIGICNANREFIKLEIVYPGSFSYEEMLNETKIPEEFAEKNFNNKYIITNCNYPSQHWLKMPKNKDELNTWEDIKEYKTIITTSKIIEEAFALLINRWTILTKMDKLSISNARNIIMACGILHNFCLSTEKKLNKECSKVLNTPNNSELLNASLDNSFDDDFEWPE